MRKLFKGGNYSREETICGNTVYKILSHTILLKSGTMWKPIKTRKLDVICSNGGGLLTLRQSGVRGEPSTSVQLSPIFVGSAQIHKHLNQYRIKTLQPMSLLM